MSRVITDSHRVQYDLALEPGLTDTFSSAREVCAQGIYQRGLKKWAAELDTSPGNLSVALSGGGDPHRKFAVEEMEEYMTRSGDLRPLYYLIERFLRDQAAARSSAIEEVKALLEGLPEKLAAAGIAPGRRR